MTKISESFLWYLCEAFYQTHSEQILVLIEKEPKEGR
jgi:hypothetical protein